MSSQVSRSALRKPNKNAIHIKVALLGLNRVTGSLGIGLRSLSERPNTKLVFTVLGRDEDKEAMKTAHRIGAVDDFNKTLQAVVQDADIVFVDVPVSQMEELYIRLGAMLKTGAVVIDLSPVKSSAVRWAAEHFPKDLDGKQAAYLVGATPLLSFDQLYSADHSIEAAQEFLFRNSDILIAPHATVPAEAVKVVTDIAELLNMKPRFMDPAEHDGLATLTEHMPLLLSVILFQAVNLSPGKLDIMRAANARFASVVQNLRHVTAQDIMALWQPNKATLLQQIEQIMQSLDVLAQAIESTDDPLVLETHLEQLVDAFIAWEVNREQNRWDKAEANVLDNLPSVGVLNIGVFNPRRRNEKD